jgi:GNAT superfamily N-acetyltransferase
MEIRPIEGPEDLRCCTDIFFSSLNDLHERQGLPPLVPEECGWMPHSVAHLAKTDPESVVLASEGAEPVAFGAAFRRDDYWCLAYLFVLTASQGRGVGRRILEHLLPTRDGLTLATGVESTQPVSTMLYASFGIAPRVPWYDMLGPLDTDLLPPLEPGVAVEPPHEADLDALAAFDRGLLGFARAEEHAWWMGSAEVARAYRNEAGSVVGYGYLWSEDDWLGPVAGRDEGTTLGIVRDIVLARGSQKRVEIPLPGSSGAALQALLRAGARVKAEPPEIYCSNGPLLPTSHLPFAPFLP